MDVLIPILMFIGVAWLVMLTVFSGGFTIAAFVAKGTLVKIGLVVIAASPFLYTHIKHGLIDNEIERRAAFVASLEREPLTGDLPDTLVVMGRLDRDDLLRLHVRFDMSKFVIQGGKKLFGARNEFDRVSVLPSQRCENADAAKARLSFELWQLNEADQVCLRVVSKTRIPFDDLPSDALYFFQGDETSFAEGMIGHNGHGPLAGSRQYELRNGRYGPLIAYYETPIEAAPEVFFNVRYSSSGGSLPQWTFLQRAIDPTESYGGYTRGMHLLRPRQVKLRTIPEG